MQNGYKRLVKKWCDYYDSQNELLGDRSPFIDYKYEIQRLVDEDEELFNNLYEDGNYYSSSDDEFTNFDD